MRLILVRILYFSKFYERYFLRIIHHQCLQISTTNRGAPSKLCPNGPEATFPARDLSQEQDPVGIIRDIYYFDTFQDWTVTDYEKSGFKTGETPDFIKGELRDELSKVSEDWQFLGKQYPVVGGLDFSDETWVETYGKSQEKCVVRAMPMNTMGLQWDFEADDFAGTTMSGNQMLSLISGFLKEPEFVDSMIETFYNDHDYTKYETNNDTNDSFFAQRNSTNSVQEPGTQHVSLSLAIHWRFDKSDWLQMREDAGVNGTVKVNPGKYENAWEAILDIQQNPDHLAESILSYMNDVARGISYTGKVVLSPLKIYIASPAEEAELVERVKLSVMERFVNYDRINSVSVLTSKQLIDWKQIKYNQDSCDWVDKNWYEISSTIEQAMCGGSDVFLHTEPVSTWSAVVVGKRKSTANDEQKEFTRFDRFVLHVASEF